MVTDSINKESASRYELGIRSTDYSFKAETITSSMDAFKYASKFYFDDMGIFESCFIILMNKSCKTIGWAKISQGGTSGMIVDSKIICKFAVDSLADSVILVHNHPSGNLKPSQQDREMTKKVKDALRIMDTTLLDHLILSKDGYFSFSDEQIVLV